MATTLNTALRFELVGQEALVHDPAGGLVVRLTGPEHSVIVRLTNGEQIVDPTEVEQAAIDRLIEAGIVLKDDSSSSIFSRRRVMQLSAAGVAAAGLTYLVLPSAAAAASTPTTTTIPTPTTSPTITVNPLLSAVSLEDSGLIEVRWRETDGSFTYRWTVVLSGGRTTTFQGIANSGTFVSTGVTLVTGESASVTLEVVGAASRTFALGPF